MQLTIDNHTVISILESLSTKLDLSIEAILELCIAHTDSDQVLALGEKLSQELKQQTTEQPLDSTIKA